MDQLLSRSNIGGQLQDFFVTPIICGAGERVSKSTFDDTLRKYDFFEAKIVDAQKKRSSPKSVSFLKARLISTVGVKLMSLASNVERSKINFISQSTVIQ